MLLSANLQGFCRDIYTESLMIVTVNAPTLQMMGFIEAMGSAGVELDRVNPKWKSIRADFDRFGFDVGAALSTAAAAAGGVTLMRGTKVASYYRSHHAPRDGFPQTSENGRHCCRHSRNPSRGA